MSTLATVWHENSSTELKQLAEVAVVRPVTQASVERRFSGLRFILDYLHLGLKEDIIDAITLLRYNT